MTPATSPRLRALALAACALLFQTAPAQELQKAPEQAPSAPAKEGQQQPGKKQPKPGEPKPYEEVVTKEAVSQEGLFKVHRIDDKVYFEIPATAYGKELLWQTEISEVPNGFTFIGTPVGTRVVTFTRRNNTVHLRNVDHHIRAEGEGALKLGVEAANLKSILMAFPVEAEGKDESAVIDVTKLFTSDPPEFSAKNWVGGAGVDPSRSFVDKIKAFPKNIETRATLTFQSGPRQFSFFGGDMMNPTGLSSVTALVHYSLVELPEKPMMGRFADSRVGYFTVPFATFGRPENRGMFKEYIARFRLEKKDPSAEFSEPVKPITFYIAREVPEKWRKYVKAGVEAWQPAFEKAGFKNAIVCLEAPSRAQDPDWDPEDARYSVIRWAPSMIENAMGPSIQDPRSGETISAHIVMWHNVLKLAENWFFVQASPNDPRAQRLPIADDLLGECLQYVVSHEVGHTLGLQHNMKASSSYSVAQLRDPKFTAEHGNEASIMDYGRFNYVAQPGDGARLIPLIGPYDHFAIEWGYKPLPSSTTPDQEKRELDKIASRQVSNPMLRFGRRWEDPTVATEDLGSDAIEATRLGLKNIQRVARNLIPATAKFGEDYQLTAELYGELQFQRMLELSHVAKLIGGVVETDYHFGHGGEVFQPVPADRQALAMNFLLKYGFYTPTELLNPDLLRRIAPSGSMALVLQPQEALLRSVLSESRVRRMFDIETTHPRQAYPVSRMVAQLQKGVWSELDAKAPEVDPHRRALQRAYLRVLEGRVSGMGASQTELKVIGKDSLRTLAKTIDKSLARTSDKPTALHLAECRVEIERILKPNNVAVTMPSFSLWDLFGISGARSFCDPKYRGLLLEGLEDPTPAPKN